MQVRVTYLEEGLYIAILSGPFLSLYVQIFGLFMGIREMSGSVGQESCQGEKVSRLLLCFVP